MSKEKHENEHIIVEWNKAKCKHAAECVRGLPRVFNPRNKPWINLDNTDAQTIAHVVGKCPNGALSAQKK